MGISETMQQRNTLSFEVFPPKTDIGMNKLCGDNGVLDKMAHIAFVLLQSLRIYSSRRQQKAYAL